MFNHEKETKMSILERKKSSPSPNKSATNHCIKLQTNQYEITPNV